MKETAEKAPNIIKKNTILKSGLNYHFPKDVGKRLKNTYIPNMTLFWKCQKWLFYKGYG